MSSSTASVISTPVPQADSYSQIQNIPITVGGIPLPLKPKINIVLTTDG